MLLSMPWATIAPLASRTKKSRFVAAVPVNHGSSHHITTREFGWFVVICRVVETPGPGSKSRNRPAPTPVTDALTPRKFVSMPSLPPLPAALKYVRPSWTVTSVIAWEIRPGWKIGTLT